MISENRYFAWCMVFVVAAGAMTVGQERAGAQDSPAEKQRQLIGVLRSDAPPQDKAITCKRLAIYGTDEAVPVLAPLLSDEQLASWARIALEAIPGSAADEALREAMGRLEGRLLIGAINSIAVRRDTRAVNGLARKLKDTDAAVAAAAAVALGRIGGAEPARVLENALAPAPVGVRSAVAEGYILCAEKYLADEKHRLAMELYDAVR